MKQYFVNNITEERHKLLIPIEAENIKASWQYSTDFPICVDRGISTENFEFYKEDAEFLRKIYEEMGAAANVSLHIVGEKINIVLTLDFSSVNFTDVKFACGYKFTTLPDVLNDFDNVGDFEFTDDEVCKFSLFSDIPTKFTAKKDYIPLRISFKSLFDKKLYLLAENINKIDTDITPSGYSVNQSMNLPAGVPERYGGTDCLFQQTSPTSLISWIPSNSQNQKTSKSFVKFDCELSIDTWFIRFVKRLNPSDIKVTLTLHLTREKAIVGGSTFTDVDTIADEQVVDLDEVTMSTLYDYIFKFHAEKALNLPISEDFNDKMHTYHLYFTIKMLANSANIEFFGDASRKNRMFGGFSIKNFEFRHNLTNVNRSNQNLIAFNDFIDKINEKHDIFKNEAAEILSKCYISSNNFMRGKSAKIKLKLTELMHDVSLLYGLKFVENSGKYHIRPIAQGDDVITINDFSNVSFENLENYNELKVGNADLPDNHYIEQIFYGIARTEGFENQKRNTREIQTKLLTSGDDVFNELVTGKEPERAIIFHTENHYQVVNSENGRKINEFYSVRGILARLAPYIYSFVKPSGTLTIDKVTPFFNVTLIEAEDDDLDTRAFIGTISDGTSQPMTSPLFKHYSITCDIPCDFSTISNILSSPKRLKIGEKIITATKIEFGISQKTIQIVGYVEN